MTDKALLHIEQQLETVQRVYPGAANWFPSSGLNAAVILGDVDPKNINTARQVIAVVMPHQDTKDPEIDSLVVAEFFANSVRHINYLLTLIRNAESHSSAKQ